MTGELPQTVLVMISDEAGAGRIVVELDAFIRFNIELDRQLADLESRMYRELPQLALRGQLARHSRAAI